MKVFKKCKEVVKQLFMYRSKIKKIFKQIYIYLSGLFAPLSLYFLIFLFRLFVSLHYYTPHENVLGMIVSLFLKGDEISLALALHFLLCTKRITKRMNKSPDEEYNLRKAYKFHNDSTILLFSLFTLGLFIDTRYGNDPDDFTLWVGVAALALGIIRMIGSKKLRTKINLGVD